MSKLISLGLNTPWPKPVEKRDGSLENPAIPLAWPVELELDGLFGVTSASGVKVSELIALQDATVYACVRARSETMGQMPLNVFEMTKVRGEPALTLADDLPLFDVLHNRANPFMSSSVWRETMQMSLDIFGNAYSVIERNGADDIVGLWPRNPKKIKVWVYHPDDNAMPDELWFLEEPGDRNPGEMKWIKGEDMVHIPGLGFDGLTGLSPIKYFMKNTIGLAIAAETFGSRFYANYGRPGGVLVYKGSKLDDTTRQTIKESFMEAQGGRNQGRPAVLTGDWDFHDMQVPPNEMQFLELRKLQATQICGMFRVPPHKLGIIERATSSNIEHQSIEFVRDCMGPILNKWEQELTFKLLPKAKVGRNAGRKYIASFDWSDLIQGDFKELVDGLSVVALNGIESVNECRRKLKLNPIGPEGDLHTVQSQLTTLEALQATAQHQIEHIDDPPPAPVIGGMPPPGAQPQNKPQQQPAVKKYSLVFNDAFCRVCARDNRTLDSIKQAFGPVLTSISDDYNDQAEALWGTKLADVSEVVDDYIGALAKRATKWSANQAPEEFEKTIRSLRVAVWREVATKRAKETA